MFFFFLNNVPFFILWRIQSKRICNNNSRDTRITANVPLLNLNLNYEKLRHKDSKFYLLNNIHHANFCIL